MPPAMSGSRDEDAWREQMSAWAQQTHDAVARIGPQVDKLETRIDARLEKVEGRLESLSTRLGSVEAKLEVSRWALMLLLPGLLYSLFYVATSLDRGQRRLEELERAAEKQARDLKELERPHPKVTGISPTP